MNGKIYFNTTEELADFLKAFTGSTAVFESRRETNGKWVVEFLGGY